MGTECWVKTNKDGFENPVSLIESPSVKKSLIFFFLKNAVVHFNFSKYIFLVALILDWLPPDWNGQIVVPDYRMVELNNNFKHNYGIF